MKNPIKNILINSTIAFVSAFLITTFIHELGHFLSYLLFGAKPILYHNYVQTADQVLGVKIRVISGLAGPFISLLQGVLLGLIVARYRMNTATHLLFLWLSLLGFVNFFGYLVMTPFSTAGDTGRVAQMLDIGYSIRFIIAIIGFAMLIWVLFKMAKYFTNFIPTELIRSEKAKYIYHIMFFPIMIGSIVNTLLAFPIAAFLSAVYPLTSSYVIMSSFPVILKTSGTNILEPEVARSIMKSLVIIFISTIVLNRLLTFGFG